MSRPVSNLRLFVGAYPNEAARQSMLALLDTQTLPAHRPTPADQLHLTVQFIGDVAANELEDVRESVRRSAAGVGRFELAPLRLLTLPRRGAARLVALETDAPSALLELHRRLVQRLAAKPRERPSERFLPHFTLTRFCAAVAGFALEEPVVLPPFAIDCLRLMRSTLAPAGSVHHEVERVELG